VPLYDHTPYSHPLDVLRRFMPSPLKKLLKFEEEIILVETNDSSLLMPLVYFDSQATSAISPAFHWKLLRDADVRGKPARATIFVAESLLVANMGRACLAGMDLERKELLAFIGGEVDPQDYQIHVFPVLSGLTQFAMGKKSAIGVLFPNKVAGANA
jgi:hypothetical protein